MLKKLSILLLALFISFPLFAVPEMIKDPFPIEEELKSFPFYNSRGYEEEFLDECEINLITVSPGKEIFSYFGHTALELNTSSFPSIFFDTGIFSYTDTFVKDLLQGRLLFGAYRSYGDLVRASFEEQWREVITLPLDLTNDAKAGTIDFTTYHAKSENHIYLYDYYFDNCATRIRDIVNKALDGKLEEFGVSIEEGTTFRKLTTTYMTRSWPINFTFNFLEGPSIDRPITRYEAAFIPERLDTLVRDYQAGTVTKTEYPLYSSTMSLTFETLTISTFTVIALYLLLQTKGNGLKRLSHFISFLIYLYLGGLASVLFYMQNFSYHQVTYNNENLFIISPLILILALEQIICVFKLDHRSRLATFVVYLSIFSAIILLLLKGLFMNTFSQNNFYVFALIAPFYFFEATRHKKMEKTKTEKSKFFNYL